MTDQIESGGLVACVKASDRFTGKVLSLLKENGMTPRQYAAIKLKVPSSGLDWLDEMITESRRMDFVGQAISGSAIEIQNSELSPCDFMDNANAIASKLIGGV